MSGRLGAWSVDRDESGAPLTAQRREVGVGDRARVVVWPEFECSPGGARLKGYRWSVDHPTTPAVGWNGWEPVGQRSRAVDFLRATHAAARAALRLGWELPHDEVTSLSLAEIAASRSGAATPDPFVTVLVVPLSGRSFLVGAYGSACLDTARSLAALPSVRELVLVPSLTDDGWWFWNRP